MANSQPTSVTAGRTIGLILAPTNVRIAQTLGLTLSLYTSGQLLSTSFTTIPALLLSPAPTLLQQWRRVAIDASRAVKIACSVSLLGFTWLAYQEPTRTSRSFYCYTIGASMTLMALGFCRFSVWPREWQLALREVGLEEMAEAEKSGEGLQLQQQSDSIADILSRNVKRLGNGTDGLSVHQLVDQWAFMNAISGALLCMGSVTALWGVVCNDLTVFELFELAVPSFEAAGEVL